MTDSTVRQQLEAVRVKAENHIRYSPVLAELIRDLCDALLASGLQSAAGSGAKEANVNEAPAVTGQTRTWEHEGSAATHPAIVDGQPTSAAVPPSLRVQQIIANHLKCPDCGTAAYQPNARCATHGSASDRADTNWALYMAWRKRAEEAEVELQSLRAGWVEGVVEIGAASYDHGSVVARVVNVTDADHWPLGTPVLVRVNTPLDGAAKS